MLRLAGKSFPGICGVEPVDEHMSNVNVVNLESSYKVMGEVIVASEKVYRETVAANLGGMNDLIQRTTVLAPERSHRYPQQKHPQELHMHLKVW